VEPRASTVAVLGASGTTRDLVGAVVRGAGFRVRRLAPDERRAAGDAPVVVLVDPRPEDWEAARRAGRVVVMVDEPLAPAAVATLVLEGADAVLHSGCSTSEMSHAINAVADGGSVLAPAEARAVVDVARALRAEGGTPPIRLTDREHDILRAIADGLSVKQTARALGVADKTIENLQSRLYKKLGVRNRVQAIAQAHALGLVE
jgi:DNA-binding NarL/FixJ family response regulator